jgi:hypothetical protein
MISVGRSAVSLKTSRARSSAPRSLASGTRVTFQPYARKRVPTSSLKARSVPPSMVIRFES